MTRALYPVFLDLTGLPVVLVGGGTVASGKLSGLLDAGARVTVVAPSICAEIRSPPDRISQTDARQNFHDARQVRVIAEAFRAEHLDGARYVVSAAPPDVNLEVARAAAERGLFVNAVDDVAAATAILGGVVRRADVTIAISTGGIAPALAGLLREALEALLPVELERWIEVAAVARKDWKAAKVPMAERRPLLLRALDRLYAKEAA
jgi:uroporphyrin-III C-methyltransferase/precorrin-2 dehydrogenase/sirohydrochlorin ferrochelatase